MIKIIQQDITTLQVDCIVNAANKSLLGGGGVDGAIHKAAGPRLFSECKTLGGCETGQAKITLGYNLPAKYIIHTVGPVWSGGQSQEPELLQSCYLSCMTLAKQQQLQSIAFPAISCGAYGYPIALAAAIAVSTIGAFMTEQHCLQTVYLVCFGDAVLTAYNEEFEKHRH